MFALLGDVIHEGHDGQALRRGMLVVDAKGTVFGDDQLQRLVEPAIPAVKKGSSSHVGQMREGVGVLLLRLLLLLLRLLRLRRLRLLRLLRRLVLD